MPLIDGKCPYCQEKVNQNATACPHCTRDLFVHHKVEPMTWVILAIAIVAGIGWVIYQHSINP